MFLNIFFFIYLLFGARHSVLFSSCGGAYIQIATSIITPKKRIRTHLWALKCLKLESFKKNTQTLYFYICIYICYLEQVATLVPISEGVRWAQEGGQPHAQRAQHHLQPHAEMTGDTGASFILKLNPDIAPRLLSVQCIVRRPVLCIPVVLSHSCCREIYTWNTGKLCYSPMFGDK